MTRTKDVHTALVNVLKSLSIATGYLKDWPAAKIYNQWDKKVQDLTRDDSFPKIFVVTERGDVNRGIGGNDTAELGFLIFVTVKRVGALDSGAPQVLLEEYLTDIEEALSRNSTLQNTVNDAFIEFFVMDGGVLEPEGSLIVKVGTTRYT